MNPNDPVPAESRDELGDRMKMYERLWCYGRPNPDAPPSERLTPGLPVCVRIDGRAFHTFAAGLTRPYDIRLAALMVSTTRRLVEETNARVGVWIPETDTRRGGTGDTGPLMPCITRRPRWGFSSSGGLRPMPRQPVPLQGPIRTLPA